MGTISVRQARTKDISAIAELCGPLIQSRVLLGKEKVELYESVQEFLVAEDQTGKVIGCGALHVMWEDLAEVRTLAVATDQQEQGIGRQILEALLERAKTLGLSRIFCLTFEVEFFAKSGFEPIAETPVDPEVYAELVRSHDEGIAEFLDLARVKQNTLGNTRMLKRLTS
jgi:amino-acid N-acetyltransferase